MTCENQKKINCPCTRRCRKHGKCCACIAHHSRRGGFPGCFFSEKAEKTYDRSFEALLKDRNQ